MAALGWLLNLGFAAGTAAEAPQQVETTTGGWGFWYQWDRENERRRQDAKTLRRKKRQAEQIENELDRKLALAQRELEEKELRTKELARMTKLVERHRHEVSQISDRIDEIYQKAVEKRTYSAREQLDREIRKLREEEDFLIMAAEIIFSQ